MEVPILLAVDTTEGWNHGDTALGASEFAIEVAGEREDKTPIKHLLIGDGKPVGPGGAGPGGRLRATPELIAGLPEELAVLAKTIEDLEVHHDDSLKGKGTEESPLSVVSGSLKGLGSMVALVPDGKKNAFELPADFLIGGLCIVMVNGLGQDPGADYTLDSNERKIIFSEVPESQDKIAVYYINNVGEKENED